MIYDACLDAVVLESSHSRQHRKAFEFLYIIEKKTSKKEFEGNTVWVEATAKVGKAQQD